MSVNLTKAMYQWAERPADQRFWTLEEMATKCREYRAGCATSSVYYNQLRAEADGGDLRLVGRTGQHATLTNYAFGQLASRAGAPAGYLRGLPATLAAQNLNHGLKNRDAEDTAHLLFHKNGELTLRAALSERYERVWNHEVLDVLVKHVADRGWRVPPARPSPTIEALGSDAIEKGLMRPATEDDVIQTASKGLGVKVGDMICPSGLYASDHDMFCFLVDDERTLNNPADPNTPLARGFFLWNSEVGDKSIGWTTFLYDSICGNHIVWGARNVREIRLNHVGAVDYRFRRKLMMELRQYSESSAQEDELKLERCQTFMLGQTKQEAVDKLMEIVTRRRLPLTKTICHSAIDVAHESDRYGDPKSLWAAAQGLTELSQRTTHADARVKMDRAAGKLLQIAF